MFMNGFLLGWEFSVIFSSQQGSTREYWRTDGPARVYKWPLMWLITRILDTLVDKTLYVSSHIRHPNLDIKIIHLYGPPTPSIYIMWLVNTLCALIWHAYLNRKKYSHCQLILSKSYSKGGNPGIMKIKNMLQFEPLVVKIVFSHIKM